MPLMFVGTAPFVTRGPLVQCPAATSSCASDALPYLNETTSDTERWYRIAPTGVALVNGVTIFQTDASMLLSEQSSAIRATDALCHPVCAECKPTRYPAIARRRMARRSPGSARLNRLHATSVAGAAGAGHARPPPLALLDHSITPRLRPAILQPGLADRDAVAEDARLMPTRPPKVWYDDTLIRPLAAERSRTPRSGRSGRRVSRNSLRRPCPTPMRRARCRFRRQTRPPCSMSRPSRCRSPTRCRSRRMSC